MSETEYGTAWPPGSDDSTDTDTDDSEGDQDETPDRYVPDHLAEYTVHLKRNGGMGVNICSPALAPLYAVPGDRLRVYDHPDGVLLTHADHKPGDLDE